MLFHRTTIHMKLAQVFWSFERSIAHGIERGNQDYGNTNSQYGTGYRNT